MTQPTHDQGTNWRPIPDPTLLTTQQLEREIGHVTDLLRQELQGDRELYNERFASIERMFAEKDIRFNDSVSNSKEAVATAFINAKEAVTKSETTTNATISQLEKLINEARDRILAIESGNRGQVVANTNQQVSNSFVVGTVIGLAGVAIAAIAVFTR